MLANIDGVVAIDANSPSRTFHSPDQAVAADSKQERSGPMYPIWLVPIVFLVGGLAGMLLAALVWWFRNRGK